MSQSLILQLLLNRSTASPHAFVEGIVRVLDDSGLRYGFYGPPLVTYSGPGPHGNPDLRAPLLIDPARRVSEATKAIMDSAKRAHIHGRLNCGEWRSMAIVAMRNLEVHGEKWLLQIDLDAKVEHPELERGRSCLESFLLAGPVSWFDQGIAVFGRGMYEFDDRADDVFNASTRGLIPDIFPINMYPAQLMHDLGQTLRDAVSRHGEVLIETPRGSVVWRMRKINRAFLQMSAEQRLLMFGLRQLDSRAIDEGSSLSRW